MADQIILKKCPDCKQEYPATNEYFHKSKLNKYGLAPRCKACVIAAAKKWVIDHPDRAKKTQQAYYQKNKSEHDAYSKQYAIEHPEQIKTTQTRFRSNHPGRRQEIARKYASTHPEQHIKWRVQNPDKYRANNKAHKQRRRIMCQQADGSFTQQDILDLYAEQNQRCAYCGILITFDIPKDVHVDHIMPLSRGGSNWPDNLALTCQACNLSKGSKTLAEWRAVRGW